MGLGLKLGKKVITAWTKTCASDSVLAMRRVNINPLNLRFAPQLKTDFVQIGKSTGSNNILRCLRPKARITPRVPVDRTVREEYKSFLSVEDIIPPSELSKMSKKDYVLLTHRSIDVPKVKIEGLKSFEVRASEPQATEEMIESLRESQRFLAGHGRQYSRIKGFGYDPSTLYFSPIVEGGQYKCSPKNITIAIPKSKCRIFNREERMYGTVRQYCDNSMTVDEYEALMLNKPELHRLTRDKKWTQEILPENYNPECCILGGVIPPEFFLS